MSAAHPRARLRQSASNPAAHAPLTFTYHHSHRRLGITKGDSPRVLAEQFAKVYALDEVAVAKLVNLITATAQAHQIPLSG